jgi:hypothetical protein
MFTIKHFINLISSSVIGLISLIFVYKYSLVNFNHPALLAVAYILLFIFVIFSFDRIKIITGRKEKNKYFFTAIIFFVLLLLYYVLFTSKPNSSFELLSIKNWLDNFYHGEFPYRLRSTFTAYPFLYLFASPFYWTGNIALLEVLAWALVGLLLILHSITVREKIIKLFFLLVSPLTFYGLFESSGYFLNAVILIILIFLSNKYLTPGKVDIKFISIAVLFGLFFTVKLEVIIVLIIYLLFLFRNNIKDGLLFFEIFIAVFLITIMPFILWNPVLFFFNGPFSLFFRFSIPWWELLIFLVASFYIGWIISDLQEIFFVSAVLLIIPSLFNLLIKPDAGLSNFIFCLPFLIFSIKDYRVEKFVGKVLQN